MTNGVLTAIGLMSGTSLDGVDAALIRTDGDSLVEPGQWVTAQYSDALRDRIRGVLGRKERDESVDDAERGLTQHHIDVINKLLKDNGISYSDIDIIGFHGHTVTHNPNQRFTWQLGDARMLADRTKTDVVADFRLADVAAGGQGAPFAPLYHRVLAGDLDKPVAVLNIGGVANVTWIGEERLLAFDAGPGNALIDDWVARHDRGRFDRDGDFARGGTAAAPVVARMLGASYFVALPPKSLDRQDFDLALMDAQSLEDGAATLTAVTVGAIMSARAHFPKPAKKWLVTGGGRHNAYMMECLAKGLGATVEPVETVGWQGDALEAQAFGYLAARSLRGLPLSLPTTTGVPEPTTGGRLVRPE
jgi:anhydro-N-acetylmuramic acid kinase